MSVSAPTPADAVTPNARLPKGAWAAIAFCTWAAVAPIPLYYALRASEVLPAERWAGSSPFDMYFTSAIVYHGGAAACGVLVAMRDRRALWPALIVFAWIFFLRVLKYLRTASQPEPSVVWSDFMVVAIWLAVTAYVLRLRRRKILV
jgi:hypothetical protein